MPRPKLEASRREIMYGLTAGGLLALSGCMGDNGTDTAPDETGNTGAGQQPISAKGNESDTEATTDQSDDTLLDDSASDDEATTDNDSEPNEAAEDEDDDEPTGETHTLTVNLVNYENGSPREDGYIVIDDGRTVDSDAGGDPTLHYGHLFRYPLTSNPIRECAILSGESSILREQNEGGAIAMRRQGS